jgi:hypothetical protein
MNQHKTPQRFTYKMVANGLTRQNVGPNSWAVIDKTTSKAVSYFRSRDTARSGAQRLNAKQGLSTDSLLPPTDQQYPGQTLGRRVHDALLANGDVGDLKT